MSGGKGGSTTQSVEIPDYIQQFAYENLLRGQRAANVGYIPYTGPDVAAFNPTQVAAMGNNARAAQAFGLQAPSSVMAGMPEAQEFAGGMMGYSSYPMFEEALAGAAKVAPGAMDQYNELFANNLINPDQVGLPYLPMEQQLAPGDDPADFSRNVYWDPATQSYRGYAEHSAGGFGHANDATYGAMAAQRRAEQLAREAEAAAPPAPNLGFGGGGSWTGWLPSGNRRGFLR